jgi:hypothetical protein
LAKQCKKHKWGLPTITNIGLLEINENGELGTSNKTVALRHCQKCDCTEMLRDGVWEEIVGAEELTN